ncbi:hypothetical protein ACHAXT_007873 [Thalassiosira profunda]
MQLNMKARRHPPSPRIGEPIRRPPPSSGESSGLSFESSGYASSSGYSSGSSSTTGHAESIMERMASLRDDNAARPSVNIDIRGGSSRVGAGRGASAASLDRSASLGYSTLSPSERARIARTLLLFACLWPLLSLLIPPSASHSHVALLSAGVDTMDAQSLSQHIEHIERRTHEKIDKLRSKVSGNVMAKTQFLREEMKSLLHRTDVVGYGPSKPRVAVVVVVPSPPQSAKEYIEHEHAEHAFEEQTLFNGALEAVESVFRTTDRNRIFVVTVVMDGRGKLGSFESRLDDIDAGRTAHRHGDQVHTHDHHKKWKAEDEKKAKKEGKEGGEHAHSEKIHAIYNHETLGVAAARKEGVQFVDILAKKHEEAGLKSEEEDLILLFLRCDARLQESEGKRTWLDDVTDALILTPPEDDGFAALLGGAKGAKATSTTEPLAPANAVSFVVDFSSTDNEGNVEVHPSKVGDTLSFDESLHPVHASATAQQMSLSNGESYPAPIAQAATALRLATYNAFPASDNTLKTHYSADLELSFNLWMCADGIDILGSSLARVTLDPQVLSPLEKNVLPGPLAARIVSAWMSGHEDDTFADGILQEVAAAAATTYVSRKYHNQPKDHANLEEKETREKMQELKHTLVRIAAEAKHSASFPSGLATKCRPFSWYAAHVHGKFRGGEDSDGDPPKPRDLMLRKPPKKEEKILPSKPLSKERMFIVSNASPVDLKYVDASGGHREHPHKGGTDEDGNFGYVHDEASLHDNAIPWEFDDEEDHAQLCKKGDPNYKMLTEKVYVDLAGHGAAERRAEHGLAKRGRAKIFCLVYTIEKFHDRIPAIRETWGQKCDGFMVASTKTDKILGTVNIPHEGPEEYDNIWQKVRSMWSYVYDNYYEKYDYFHIGGDDLYLIVENLRLYLESEEIQLASNGGHYLPDGSETAQTPLFMGRRFAEGGNRDRMFISGGAGYTMNKAALKTLVVEGFPKCGAHMHTFSEDVMVATCFRKMGILPYDTKDEAGGERYMPFQPGHHLTYRPPKNPKDDWYANYSVDVKWGIDHCAAKSVAFHYIKGDLMFRMHAIIYHLC